ncbi:3-dehydroquinate synthase [Pseudactinotalea sp. Z1748]|uniref:3-dehydroquinate synthase n=1 Tax=Pseudactinotalea sp. Z1748 TaxID=3413027 RepID=UPI003C7C97C7
MNTIWVDAEHRYPVQVGTGLRTALPGHLPGAAAQVLLVYARALGGAAADLADQVRATGRSVVPMELPDGEAAKELPVIARAWDLLGEHAFTRTDVVVGLGGGAVTDAAGFIAASWLRGVGVVHLPSTLLGMVDAAVGGKTGINTAAGKNLVGAFHSPLAVLCDTDLLGTLPEADLRAGMAEVVKCGFIADPAILELIESDPAAALDPAGAVLTELVHRAITVKARVVSADLREADQREILNYGHTLAHAIENAESYRWRHGDAVAVGMVFAAELAWRTGHLGADVLERHRRVLRSLGLPIHYDGAPWTRLAEAMRRDKKARGGVLRFVILEGTGAPVRLQGPDEEELVAAFESVSSSGAVAP